MFSTLFLTADASTRSCQTSFEKLGVEVNSGDSSVHFGLLSPRAERVELELFENAIHAESIGKYVLERSLHQPEVWKINLPQLELNQMGRGGFFGLGQLVKPLYYGYRLWGPNWNVEQGFKSDVDGEGNRFNPNKLVFDPHAMELSHDPLNAEFSDKTFYRSGPNDRDKDSGSIAPKGMILNPLPKTPSPLTRPLREDIIYEVHLRGFTRNDPSVPEEERGTFKGAARKAKYLKELGVTAVEFLPLQEFQDALNSELDTSANNYWGYMTQSYFALNSRFATAESRTKMAGVIEEFREMIRAFHAEGIKVLVDVVYNHTGEGGVDPDSNSIANLHSFRGIANETYYQLGSDPEKYQDNTGCGANLNCANRHVQNLVIDSLIHLKNLGVDGFRFDLASVLGNVSQRGDKLLYDKMAEQTLLNRIIREVGARPEEGGLGVDLIAEPWAIGENSYQLGHFPFHPDLGSGYGEWNGKYRDIVRAIQNKRGVESVTPRQLSSVLGGSKSTFESTLRGPAFIINFIAAHDGFPLADLYRFNEKNNNQVGIYGPSDGGEDHNRSWDQMPSSGKLETQKERQLQAARTGFALPMLSLGVPMFTGGDEFLRSQMGNNNMWNVDSIGSWLNWTDLNRNRDFYEYSKRVIAFRKKYAIFNPAQYYSEGADSGNSQNHITWLQANGHSATDSYLDNPHSSFLGYRIKAQNLPPGVNSVYVGYNYGSRGAGIHLPAPAEGKRWYWAGDTSQHYRNEFNFVLPGEEKILDPSHPHGLEYYLIDKRAVVVFIEK